MWAGILPVFRWTGGLEHRFTSFGHRLNPCGDEIHAATVVLNDRRIQSSILGWAQL